MGVQSDPVHKQVGVVLAIQNIIGKKEERTIACQAAGFTFQPMTASERERETLHLFQPPRADQMPDPLQGQD